MNEDENRKRKLDQSPARDPYPSTHDKKFHPKQSPHQLLRMMGQFAPKADRFEPVESNTAHVPPTKPIEHYVPSSDYDRALDFQRRLGQIHLLSPQDMALDKNVKLNLIRPKTRNEDFRSDHLSVSYHSGTSYSRLDYKQFQPVDDDNRSVSTQDMVDVSGPVVLDTQDIALLRREQDERTDREHPFLYASQQSVPDSQGFFRPMSVHNSQNPESSAPIHSVHLKPTAAHTRYTEQPVSIHSTRHVDTPKSVHSTRHADTPASVHSTHHVGTSASISPDPPMSASSLHDNSVYSNHQSAETMGTRDVRSVHSGFDREPSRSVHTNGDNSLMEQNIIEFTGDEVESPMQDGLSVQMSKRKEAMNKQEFKDKGKGKAYPPVVPNDFRASDDLMDDNHLADTDWGDDDYGQSWSDNELDDTTYRPPTRILPGTFNSPHISGEGLEMYNVLQKYKVKELMSQRIDFGTKLNATSRHLGMIKNMYFDQLVRDIKAYKEHRSDDTTITNEDVLLLMKRQRLLNDKTTIESLAHKYLSREYSDLLCTSALKDNERYPH